MRKAIQSNECLSFGFDSSPDHVADGVAVVRLILLVIGLVVTGFSIITTVIVVPAITVV